METNIGFWLIGLSGDIQVLIIPVGKMLEAAVESDLERDPQNFAISTVSTWNKDGSHDVITLQGRPTIKYWLWDSSGGRWHLSTYPPTLAWLSSIKCWSWESCCRDKYILQFEQIHMAIWTDMFGNLYKYVWIFRQIHFSLLTSSYISPYSGLVVFN